MAEVSGGDKAKPYLEAIAAKLGRAKAVRVGFLENATYPDGTKVAMVAAIQEFGAPRAGIPPRPYFRTMIAKESPTWGVKVAATLKAYDNDALSALEAIGLGIESQLRESIIEVNSPALSEVTLMLRMMRSQDQSLVVTGKTVAIARARVAAGERAQGVNTKPLDDTGHMLNSVASEVKL